MEVCILSFSYRGGIPAEANLVCDVRFLRNPHYIAELEPYTGEDARVAAYIREDEAFPAFFDRLTALLEVLLMRQDKPPLTVAIGCTGGRHRSVFVVEELGRMLGAAGYKPVILHREIAPKG